MRKNIEINKVIVFLIVFICQMLGVKQGFAIDLKDILKEVKAKQVKFDKEIKDMSIIQEVKMVASEWGVSNLETRILTKGEKIRIEIPGETKQLMTIVISDGKNAWMISSFTGKIKLSDEDAAEYKNKRNWWDLISETEAKILGIDKKNGERDCYIIKTRKEGRAVYKVWLDKENLLLIKEECKGPKGEAVILVHSDFRKIKEDLEMAYKDEVYIDGKLTSVSFIKTIEINKELSDDLFNPDKVKLE